MKLGSLSLLRVVLVGVLLGTGSVVISGEAQTPGSKDFKTDSDGEIPNPGTPSPDDVKPKTTPVPAETAPKPATFTDYIQNAETFSSPFKTAYPVVENKTSGVANQLVRNSSNESVFLQGSGPPQQTSVPTTLAGDVPYLHSGPFAFNTSLKVVNIFNDNFFGSAGHALTSWQQNTTPGFSMSYTPNEQTSINGFYNATLHDFSTSVEHNYYDETGGAAISIKHFGVDGLSFNISDLYTQIGKTIVNPLASSFDLQNLEFQTGTRYETNSLPVSFAYAAGPLKLEAAYAYDIVNYSGTSHREDDAQQHTGTLRGSFDVSPGHCTVFGETNFQDTRYSNADGKDFDFLNLYTGIRGRFDNLTYSVKTGCCAFDALGTGTTTVRPMLVTEARYEFSRRLDCTVFGTRSIETGILTGGSKVDSYGGELNIRPMMRGTLTLSHVWQDTFRLTGTNQQIETTELSYRHKILGWMEPRLGMKYSLDGNGSVGDQKTWTGLAGIAFNIQSRGRADVDYYHEARFLQMKQLVTDRWTTGYNYKINRFSAATFGYDHALRRQNEVQHNVRIDELRLGVNLTW